MSHELAPDSILHRINYPPEAFILENILSNTTDWGNSLKNGNEQAIGDSIDASMVIFASDQDIVVFNPNRHNKPVNSVRLPELGLRTYRPSQAMLEELLIHRALKRFELPLVDVTVHPIVFNFNRQSATIIAEASLAWRYDDENSSGLGRTVLQGGLQIMHIDEALERTEEEMSDLIKTKKGGPIKDTLTAIQVTQDAIKYCTEFVPPTI